MIATVAVVDLLYGCFVSPFFVENYVKNNWEQSSAYCSFYTFFFTFHDLFAPLCLVVLSIYISLKFTGVTAELKHKRGIYFGLAVGVISVSLLLSIPATYNVSMFNVVLSSCQVMSWSRTINYRAREKARRNILSQE